MTVLLVFFGFPGAFADPVLNCATLDIGLFCIVKDVCMKSDSSHLFFPAVFIQAQCTLWRSGVHSSQRTVHLTMILCLCLCTKIYRLSPFVFLKSKSQSPSLISLTLRKLGKTILVANIMWMRTTKNHGYHWFLKPYYLKINVSQYQSLYVCPLAPFLSLFTVAHSLIREVNCRDWPQCLDALSWIYML